MRKHSVNLIIGLCVAATLSSCAGRAVTGGSGTHPAPLLAGASIAVVETDRGRVAGYIDDGVYIYKGIPYAEADRFMPPHDVTPWEGVRSCRYYGPVCPQEVRGGWADDASAFCNHWNDGNPGEDCLRVNVWTRSINGTDGKKRPVMVWIHGGGFSAGNGQEHDCYDGRSLASTDEVVVVSLNHRLNVLGHLDLSAFGDKYKYSGNVGILDIVAALKWVQRNIAQFGGDPSNVTIFGQSGGGGKVSTLMAMPSARGLFHKAITQSGAHLENMQAKWSRKIGITTLDLLGIPAGRIDEIQSVPYERLLEAGNKAISLVKAEAKVAGEADIFLFGWSPTVDGDLLPKDPYRGGGNECSRDVPMLVGSCLHEIALSSYVLSHGRESTMEETRPLLERFLGKNVDRYIEAVAQAYPDYVPADLLDLDAMFRPNCVEQCRVQAAMGGAPVYNYLFCWESPILDYRNRSSHCMEIPFVMRNIHLAREMTGGGEDAYQLSDLMSRAWIAFAKTGNPNVEGLPNWEPYNDETRPCMLFNNTCRMAYGHDSAWLEAVKSTGFANIFSASNIFGV